LYKLLYEPQPALDEHWFNRLMPFNEELFTALGASHQQIEAYRQQFEDRPFNPDLRPEQVDINAHTQRNQQLSALRADIESQEGNPAISRAYCQKIDELIDQNRLLIASKQNDRETFDELNRSLYGMPEAATFADACAWLRQTADTSYNSQVEQVQAAARAVLDVIPDLNGSAQHIIPDDHVFKTIRERHFAAGGYIEQLFGEQVIPDRVTATEGDPITRAAIGHIGSNYQLIDSTDELWGVVHSQQVVVRPKGLDVSRRGFMGIVAHEIGSHLLERQNGLRQPLRLLSAGLDRYDSLNEGRAFLREQIMLHSPYEMLGEPDWEYIILLYLSTAFGAGLYQHPYDFKTLHAAMLPVCTLFQSLRQPDNPVYAQLKANDEAWHLCVRAAKGTDGTGGAYLKSHVYLSGNLLAWRLAADDPDVIFWGDAGKFDFSRADHRDIVDSFGIKPNL
jgi:hypothetical protein